MKKKNKISSNNIKQNTLNKEFNDNLNSLLINYKFEEI